MNHLTPAAADAPVAAVVDAAGGSSGSGGIHDPAALARPGARRTSSLDTNALPVTLSLGGRHREAVRSWVEGVLGWQSVEAGPDGLVPAALELRDPDSDGPLNAEVPTILLVDDGSRPERAGAIAARTTPDAVLGWPSGRDHLASVATDLLARHRPGAGPVRLLRVGGSSGGVGTTTVALALAGLAAWSGLRTFAAVRGTGLGLRALPAAALAAADLWARADPVAGVTSLRAVVIGDRAAAPDVVDGSIEATVIDAGVDTDVDVLVCRPDAAALAVLPATTAAAVVLVGDGPAPPRELSRAAAGRRGVRVAWSARVARAGLRGRVPAGLPGAWLTRLEPLAPHAPGGHRRRADVVHRPRGTRGGARDDRP